MIIQSSEAAEGRRGNDFTAREKTVAGVAILLLLAFGLALWSRAKESAAFDLPAGKPLFVGTLMGLEGGEPNFLRFLEKHVGDTVGIHGTIKYADAVSLEERDERRVSDLRIDLTPGGKVRLRVMFDETRRHEAPSLTDDGSGVLIEGAFEVFLLQDEKGREFTLYEMATARRQ